MSKGGRTPLGEIFIKMNKTTNPVTKSVYRDILCNRLNSIEEGFIKLKERK